MFAGLLAAAAAAAQGLERYTSAELGLRSALRELYGEAAGSKLASPLREHILIAADIVKAAKGGDGDGVAKGQAAWQANGQVGQVKRPAGVRGEPPPGSPGGAFPLTFYSLTARTCRLWTSSPSFCAS